MTVEPIASLDRWRRPTIGDVALAGGLLAVAVLSGLFIDAARPDTIEPTSWWHWLLICSPPILVAVRRVDPIVVTALVTVAQAAIWISNLPEVLLPAIVILYTAASEGGVRGRRIAVASSVVLAVVTAVGVVIAEDVTASQLPLIVLTCGTAITLGVTAARQRAAASKLAAAVAESELRAGYQRSRAISNERAHIGRELHDIIGHSLSVIAVRAEAADRVADRRPEAAREAVADIADAARSALSETRRVLAGLRRSSAAELAPPRDLAATNRLVEELAATGTDVSLISEGCERCPPSPTVAGGLHRIVQESLTNAIKHGGPGVHIDVGLTCTRTTLEVVIASRGDHAPTSPATSTLDGSAAELTGEAGGAGLIGMAERAAVLGGGLAAEQRVDGAFVVRASLPMAATRPDESDTAAKEMDR